jgi:hypothetical protein
VDCVLVFGPEDLTSQHVNLKMEDKPRQRVLTRIMRAGEYKPGQIDDLHMLWSFLPFPIQATASDDPSFAPLPIKEIVP